VTEKAKLYSYFDGYRDEIFECPVCAWSGGFEQLSRETYRDLFDGSCPQCDKMLIIVFFPTLAEIRNAATRGNEEAQKMLPLVQKREDLDAAFEREKLKSADQLPDLTHYDLEFIWDQEIEEETTIRYRDLLLWKEPAFWENWPRFNQVKEILKTKYGTRFKSLTPTERSKLYLYGDDLKAPEKISFT
jgi:hypothetical protein